MRGQFKKFFVLLKVPGRILMGLLQVIVGPMVSAVAVANICYALHLENRPPLFWIAVAPLVYLLWLIILLSFYTMQTSFLWKIYEKPRQLQHKKDDVASIRFLVSFYLYRRAELLFQLPFVSTLLNVPFFQWLVLRSYSIRTHVGKSAILSSGVTDPDLTHIGAGAILREFSRVAAHSFATTPEGDIIYQTAPIELAERCVIGGGARVEMGATIGADSIIEPHSRVSEFTKVPPGEIWGGNPAVFRAKRDIQAKSPAAPVREKADAAQAD